MLSTDISVLPTSKSIASVIIVASNLSSSRPRYAQVTVLLSSLTTSSSIVSCPQLVVRYKSVTLQGYILTEYSQVSTQEVSKRYL